MSEAVIEKESRGGDASARSLAAWEIVSVAVSTLVGEWLVFSLGGGSNALLAFPVALVFVFMFLSHRARGEGLRELGLRLDNFARAARLLIIPTLLMSAACVGLGLYFGSIDFFKWYGGQSVFGVPALGLAWGLVQQYALQGFVNRRAQIVWGRGWRSSLVVALLFGGLHLPNPTLTLVTFGGGLVWARVYQRAPNLFALGLSHSLMTWVLISTVPAPWLYGLRVGYKFFT
ncbi:MAG TPA: CPBP family glutamic-type intramembrane protease [Pyrinomonadaceae bacterium]|nr:CPBP family glutamic-type intramembrane protease [Pyrinomonadaceae bacterium]